MYHVFSCYIKTVYQQSFIPVRIIQKQTNVTDIHAVSLKENIEQYVFL